MGVDRGRARLDLLELLPERAGHGMHTVFLDDLDTSVASRQPAGLEPANPGDLRERRTQDDYLDPDGNEIGFGGGPDEGETDSSG